MLIQTPDDQIFSEKQLHLGLFLPVTRLLADIHLIFNVRTGVVISFQQQLLISIFVIINKGLWLKWLYCVLTLCYFSSYVTIAVKELKVSHIHRKQLAALMIRWMI